MGVVLNGASGYAMLTASCSDFRRPPLSLPCPDDVHARLLTEEVIMPDHHLQACAHLGILIFEVQRSSTAVR